MTQNENAKTLYDLHHRGKLLILPNIWDPLGALLLQDLGYPAIATASASVAFSRGVNDGENIHFSDLLVLLHKITTSVKVPVTADVEKGYAADERNLFENIKKLIDTGIVGINIEDTGHDNKKLLPLASQCSRIDTIRKASKATGIQLFINARTDVLLRNQSLPAGPLLNETINRGKAYGDAGADCFYPIAMTKEADIEAVVNEVLIPVNILTVPGIPDLPVLEKIGVARVSLGPAFLKSAIKAMRDLAIDLREMRGLETIVENDITSDYLRKLIG